MHPTATNNTAVSIPKPLPNANRTNCASRLNSDPTQNTLRELRPSVEKNETPRGTQRLIQAKDPPNTAASESRLRMRAGDA